MPTCAQTNEPLTPLTQSLFDSCTHPLYDQIGWPSIECNPPQPLECEVEIIDETQIKIDGVLYTPIINGKWVDFKEERIPGAIYLGRQCHLDTDSWEAMMDGYNEGQTIFKIQTNG